MKINLFFYIFIISCFLYFASPDNYSYDYCVLLHNLYLILAFLLAFKDKKNEKIGFNVFFSISFYFTNFVYPIYIYPLDPTYSLFSFGGYSPSVITKCTALALLAYSSYAWGYSSKMIRYKSLLFKSSYVINYSALKIIVSLFFFYGLIFYTQGGLDFYNDQYINGEMGGHMIVRYILQLFPPILTLMSCVLLFTCSKVLKSIILSLLLIFSFSLIFSGSRTIPLYIFIMLFVLYCTTYKVSNKLIFLCVIVGLIFMTFIGESRGSGVYDVSKLGEDNQIGIWSNVSDLIINNRNLYSLYDFAQTNTHTYGLTMLSDLLSPIPFLQGFIQDSFGIPTYMMGSAYFSTFIALGKNPSFGLGTNIVGDTYLAFGCLGTILLFYILGSFIISIRNNARKDSLYSLLIYLVFVGNSIFYVRSSYLINIRFVTWTLLLGYMLYRIFKVLRKV